MSKRWNSRKKEEAGWAFSLSLDSLQGMGSWKLQLLWWHPQRLVTTMAGDPRGLCGEAHSGAVKWSAAESKAVKLPQLDSSQERVIVWMPCGEWPMEPRNWSDPLLFPTNTAGDIKTAAGWLGLVSVLEVSLSANENKGADFWRYLPVTVELLPACWDWWTWNVDSAHISKQHKETLKVTFFYFSF